MTNKKKDIILIVLLLIIGGSLFYLFYYQNREKGSSVKITVNGILYKTAFLEENETIIIQQETGQYNELKIQDGIAFMTSASCPDLLCVHQKEIAFNGDIIVCLPNKVVVEVISKTEGEFDAVVN